MSEDLKVRRDRLSSLSKEELIAYIFDIEERVWPNCGHLGGMYERGKHNLVAVAMMYHQIEDEGLLPHPEEARLKSEGKTDV